MDVTPNKQEGKRIYTLEIGKEFFKFILILLYDRQSMIFGLLLCSNSFSLGLCLGLGCYSVVTVNQGCRSSSLVESSYPFE